MQTSGSLTQTSLATLLETMQAERATGTLAVNSGHATVNLYFLFGHLFHAAGDLGQGEDAVIGALGWGDGQFTFDPRAKLPAEETIKSAPGELLAEAERRGPPITAAVSYEGIPAGSGTEVPAVYTREETVEESGWGRTAADERPAYQAAEGARGGGAGAQPFPTTPPSPPASVPAAEPWIPSQQPSNGETKVSEAAMPTRSGAPAGEPATPVFGNPSAEPLAELYPLPAGKAIYEGLKSAFVDFPKLLRTLDHDTHTGYVRLDGDDFSGVLLLHDGHVLEALFSDGRIDQGADAFQGLRQRMEAGQGLLDVIELSGETVVALAQLLTARPLFTGLLGRFINFDALLEYLAEEKIDGSLVVAGGTETGVILLRKGVVHGAYTQSIRELSSDPRAVTALATERTARIEVKSGTAGSPAGIDVEAELRAVL